MSGNAKSDVPVDATEVAAEAPSMNGRGLSRRLSERLSKTLRRSSKAKADGKTDAAVEDGNRFKAKRNSKVKVPVETKASSGAGSGSPSPAVIVSATGRADSPDVPTALAALLDANQGSERKFVLWLGPKFFQIMNKSSKAMPAEFSRVQLFDTMIKSSKDSKNLMKLAEKLSSLALSESQELDAFQSELEAALGMPTFAALLGRAVNKMSKASVAPDVDSLTVLLLKALKPKCVFYTGTDNILERVGSGDKLRIRSITLQDIFVDKITAENLVTGANDVLVVKVNGDAARPDTLLFADQVKEKFALYGFQGNGMDIIPEEELKPLGAGWRKFLRGMLHEYSFVFLGDTLSDSDPLSYFLSENSPKLVKTDEELADDAAKREAYEAAVKKSKKGNIISFGKKAGVEIPAPTFKKPDGKHFALIPTSSVDNLLEDLKAHEQNKTNVNYITYEPDELHTQLLEFLAVMATCRSVARPIAHKPGEVAVKGFVSHKYDGFRQYVKTISMKEKDARTLYFFTDELPEIFRDHKAKLKSGEEHPFADAIEERGVTLDQRMSQPESGYDVKVMFPKAAVESDLPETVTKDNEKEVAKNIAHYQKLLKLAERAGYSLHLRLFAKKTHMERKPFSLMFLGSSEEDIGDIAYFHTEARPAEDYVVSLFELNTAPARNSFMLYEKMWHVAESESTSFKFIHHRLTATREAYNALEILEAAQESKVQGEVVAVKVTDGEIEIIEREQATAVGSAAEEKNLNEAPKTKKPRPKFFGTKKRAPKEQKAAEEATVAVTEPESAVPVESSRAPVESFPVPVSVVETPRVEETVPVPASKPAEAEAKLEAPLIDALPEEMKQERAEGKKGIFQKILTLKRPKSKAAVEAPKVEQEATEPVAEVIAAVEKSPDPVFEAPTPVVDAPKVEKSAPAPVVEEATVSEAALATGEAVAVEAEKSPVPKSKLGRFNVFGGNGKKAKPAKQTPGPVEFSAVEPEASETTAAPASTKEATVTPVDAPASKPAEPEAVEVPAKAEVSAEATSAALKVEGEKPAAAATKKGRLNFLATMKRNKKTNAPEEPAAPVETDA